MRPSIWLATLAVAVFLAGGCKQQEQPPSAPQPPPTPVAVIEQEQTGKSEQSSPVPAEKPTVPKATEAVVVSPPATAVKPAAPPPVKSVPVETTTVAPTPPLQPVPVVSVPTAPAVKPAATPATVTYKATNGNVSFDHQKHAANHACSSCHPTAPPAKIVLDKDKAHKMCKGCHQENGAGPTQCTGCHKKG